MVFQKWQSGNPNGRPQWDTLKEYARKWIMSLPDEEKKQKLAELPFEIVWKMSEGNPHSTNDVVVREPPKPIADIN